MVTFINALHSLLQLDTRDPRIRILLLLLTAGLVITACKQDTISPAMPPTEASPTIELPTQPPAEEADPGIATLPAIGWEAAVGDGLAAPAKLAGGNVIVASHQAIIAFDADSGKEQWRVVPDGGVWSKSLAVGGDRVFAGVPGGLLALDAADGRQLWFAPTQGEVLWSPLVEEAVYVPTAFVGPGIDPDPDGQAWIYALDPASGQEQWSAETETYTLTTPAAAAGTLFVGGSRLGDTEVDEGGHMRIYSFTAADGSPMWTMDNTDGFLKSLAADGQRLFYLAYTDMLYALTASNGQEVWRYPTENWSPGFTQQNEALYFGSDNAFVHAVSGSDGQAAWRTPLEGTFNGPRGRPAVDQHYVYFQGNDNSLYALDRQSGEIQWVSEPQPRSRTAVAVGDSQLYLSGQDGVLYAYR